MWLARVLFLVGMVAIVGCGPGGGAASVDEDAEAKDMLNSIKAALQDVADTGEVGEAFGEARGMADELKNNGNAKADGILKDLDALEALNTPDERKAKAKEIISGL